MGLGLLYFAPWLREARPGDMDTFLRNDIGSGDWASAGGDSTAAEARSPSRSSLSSARVSGEGPPNSGHRGVACPPIEPWSNAERLDAPGGGPELAQGCCGLPQLPLRLLGPLAPGDGTGHKLLHLLVRGIMKVSYVQGKLPRSWTPLLA